MMRLLLVELETPLLSDTWCALPCSILDSYPWISGIMKMPQIFMDTFLVLTGFMAGGTLIDALPRVSNVVHFILRCVDPPRLPYIMD